MIVRRESSLLSASCAEDVDRLTSDGAVTENGTVKVVTMSGASLTSDNVINALRDREAKQIAQREQRAAAQLQREERATQRELAQAQAQEKREIARKKAEEKEEAELQRLRSRRKSSYQRLAETRELRRKKAKTIAL